MEIFVLIDSMSPAGGIERVISKLTNIWVNELKWKVSIIVKDNKHSFYKLNENIDFYSLNINKKNLHKNKFLRILQVFISLFKDISHIKRFLNNKEVTYIYSSSIVNTIILYLLGYSKITIAAEHGSYYGYNCVYRLIKKIIYPSLRFVNSLTKSDNLLYEKMGCNSFCIPNPLSFNPTTFSKLNNNVVLNVGRLVHDKGQDMLISAWSIVAKSHPEWILNIVGSGENRDLLNKQIIDMSLTNNVFMISAHNKIEEEYLKSSIFVLSSRYEGFGMVLTEAMSFGLPCISFNCPSGPKHIIDDNINGLLVEPDNIKLLANKIIDLIENKEKRLYLGANALTSMRKYSDEAISSQWTKKLIL